MQNYETILATPVPLQKKRSLNQVHNNIRPKENCKESHSNTVLKILRCSFISHM